MQNMQQPRYTPQEDYYEHSSNSAPQSPNSYIFGVRSKGEGHLLISHSVYIGGPRVVCVSKAPKRIHDLIPESECKYIGGDLIPALYFLSLFPQVFLIQDQEEDAQRQVLDSAISRHPQVPSTYDITEWAAYEEIVT